jgi:ATP-dependent Clp protease ATP-binding subunit ClpX
MLLPWSRLHRCSTSITSALVLRRSMSTYRPSEFNFSGAGFTGNIESKESVVGPLANALAGGVKITPRWELLGATLVSGPQSLLWRSSVLKQHLDRYVVGQDRSKRILSTAIYHHYQRVHQLRRREQEQQDRLFRESQALTADPFDG